MKIFGSGSSKKDIEEKNEKDKKSENKSDEKKQKVPEMKSVTKKSEKNVR